VTIIAGDAAIALFPASGRSGSCCAPETSATLSRQNIGEGHRDWGTLLSLMRFWAVVLAANLLGRVDEILADDVFGIPNANFCDCLEKHKLRGVYASSFASSRA
jgi:hypothetical protein